MWIRVYDIHHELMELGSFHWWMFHRNSTWMEKPFHSHSIADGLIDYEFWTYHDSFAVVACSKCSSHLIVSRVQKRRKGNCSWIGIMIEKSLVKWVPGFYYLTNNGLLNVTPTQLHSRMYCRIQLMVPGSPCVNNAAAERGILSRKRTNPPITK